MTKRFWLVRPGAKGEIAEALHAKKVIAIGWPSVGDVGRLSSQEEIRQHLAQAYPELRPGQLRRATRQLSAFRFDVEDGDIIVAPFPGRRVWLAKVLGPYKYDANLVAGEYPHIRSVEWLEEVTDSAISHGLRSSIEVPNNVTSLNNRSSEISQLLFKPEAPSPSDEFELVEPRLTRLRFERFKAFDQQVEIDLAPITVIAGVNSGGKSTIIQSLLLARQTLVTPYKRTIENALEYDGDLVRFANFSEMIFGKPSNYRSGMRLGFTVESKAKRIDARLTRRRMELEIRHASKDQYAPLFAILSRLAEFTSPSEELISVNLDAQFVYNRGQKVVTIGELILNSNRRRNQTSEQGPILTIKPIGEKWRLTLDIDQRRQDLVFDSFDFDRFIPVWTPVSLSRLLEDPEELSEEPKIQNRTAYLEQRLSYQLMRETFRGIFEPALDILREELEERLFYVGPLRSAPQRTYLRRNLGGLDIGATGEFTIQQLYDHWDEEVTFAEVPLVLDDFLATEAEVNTMPLKLAVLNALRLVGLEQELKIEKLGESYEASLSLVSKPKTYVSITDVGFGVSQILPIIAVSLLSPTDSILIFEQPEIHLHPRVQAGLAELFLCLARTGRRIIVETHSDYLINRFRRRAAEDKSNGLETVINILFVEPAVSQKQGASIEKARVDRYGNITNWPLGFLVESAEDARAIMIAGSDKRLREQGEHS